LRETGKTATVLHFGPYEVDLRSEEVRKSGVRIKLSGQPFRVLAVLLERPGELVTREELHRRLWPRDTFVDFEHGLNAAVNRVRDGLNDSADRPRFVETLPRRGYRFIGELAVTKPDEPFTVPQLVHKLQDPAVGARRWWKPVVWTGASLACVLAIAIADVRFYSKSKPAQDSLLPVPFTALPGVEMYPAFSPDGSQIAFAWDGHSTSPAKGFDLYVKLIGSESPLRLTDHPSQGIAPAWSPDHTQIAFQRVDGENTGIYAVSALGGPEKKLRTTHATARVSSISWSPDGRWIAYPDSEGREDHRRLFLLSPGTLESTQIPHVEECMDELSPAFSSDGSRLAYVCYLDSGGFSIYLLAPPNGRPQLINHYTGWPWGIAWSGDGKRLILSRFEGGSDYDELYEVNLADRALHKLQIAGGGSHPAVSLKGDKLAFEARIGNATNVNIWRKDLLHPRAPGVKLIASTRNEETPQFSPDGKYIAFASNRSGNAEVWLTKSDGSQPVQLSHLGNRMAGSPRWSPDSKKIVFDSGEFGAANVYVADISERMPRKLVTDIRYTSEASWSLDAKWIYFVGNGQEAGGIIYRCPAEGGNAAVLSSERGAFPGQFFDPDTVYFASRFDGNTLLKRISLAHPGKQMPVEGLPPMRYVSDWTVVPGGIYFIPADLLQSIRFFDFRSRKVSEVFSIDTAFALGLSASPDARWLVYPQVDELDSNIMLISNLR